MQEVTDVLKRELETKLKHVLPISKSLMTKKCAITQGYIGEQLKTIEN